MEFKKQDAISFTLWGKQLSYTPERTNYLNIHRQHLAFTEIMVMEYADIYNSENKNLEDVVKKGKEQGDKIIAEAISVIADGLVYSGYYNINAEELLNIYNEVGNYDAWIDAFEKISDAYIALEYTKEQQEAYRRARKASRGRLQGGGFGIAGAAKGIAMAGAVNLTTGIAHGMVNAMGNIVGESQIFAQKNAIFNDNGTLESLISGMYAAIFSIENAIIKYLRSVGDIELDIISAQESKECRIRLENFIKINLKEKKLQEELFQLLEKDPFNQSIYEVAIGNFGDENGEIRVITDYFGLTLKLNIEKLKTLIKYGTTTKDKFEDYLEWKQDILNAGKPLGVTENDGIMERLFPMMDKLILQDWTEKLEIEVGKITQNKANLDERGLIVLNDFIENSCKKYNIKQEPIVSQYLSICENYKLDYIEYIMQNKKSINYEQYNSNKQLFEKMKSISGITENERILAQEEKLEAALEILIKDVLQKTKGVKGGFFSSKEYTIEPPKNINDWVVIYTEIQNLKLKDNSNKLFEKYENQIKEIEIATRTVKGIIYDTIEEAQNKEKELDKLDAALEQEYEAIKEQETGFYDKKVHDVQKLNDIKQKIEQMDVSDEIKKQKIQEIEQQKVELATEKKKLWNLYKFCLGESKEGFQIGLGAGAIFIVLTIFDFLPGWARILILISSIGGFGQAYNEYKSAQKYKKQSEQIKVDIGLENKQ